MQARLRPGQTPTLRELKQAVAAKPQDPQAHYSLGLKYESLGQTKKAIDEYRKSLSLKPDNDKVLYSLGRLMATGGEPDQAIKIIQQAVKLNPKSAEARSLLAAVYNQQAMALMQQGNLDAAREALEAGIQAKGDPAVTEALRNNLGCLYVRENKPDQAVGTWQEVLRQNPDAAPGALQPGPHLLHPGGLPGGLPGIFRFEGHRPRYGRRSLGLPLQD